MIDKKVLKKHGLEHCPSCGKKIDEGDISWNSGSTEAGSPCSRLMITCQGCDVELVNIWVWTPVKDMKEFFEVLDSEL
jgi:hypothetical protein